MPYALTGKASIRTKIIDGKKYALCDTSNDRELWIEIREQPLPKCCVCGYQGPALDSHHVHGRKNSDVTVLLCANCHREVHAGLRVL